MSQGIKGNVENETGILLEQPSAFGRFLPAATERYGSVAVLQCLAGALALSGIR
jgi:hypothetical protein